MSRAGRPRPPHPVTDHALIRWLERRHGCDMEGFREQLHDEVRDALAAGATAVTRGGLRYVLDHRDGIRRLITVKPVS